MRRVFASVQFALLAGMAAHNAGLPMWRDWVPGDVSDFMLVSFLAAYATIGALRETPDPSHATPSPEAGNG